MANAQLTQDKKLQKMIQNSKMFPECGGKPTVQRESNEKWMEAKHCKMIWYHFPFLIVAVDRV